MKVETGTEAVERQIERLRTVNKRLLDGERLVMRVPTDVEHDMDLIIAQAMDVLRKIAAERDALLAALEEARIHIAEERKFLVECDTIPDTSALDAAIKAAEARGMERVFVELDERWAMYLSEAERWSAKGVHNAANLAKAKARTLKAAIAAIRAGIEEAKGDKTK